MIAQGQLSEINRDYILNEVSEESILQFYLGIDRVPCVINSPLRDDKNPSFGLYYSAKGFIKYKDFATDACGNLLDLLGEYLVTDTYGVLSCIYRDLNKIKELDKYFVGGVKPKVSEWVKKNTVRTNKQLQVRVRKWKSHDIEFWNRYGINTEWLEFGKVYPISHIFFGNIHVPAEKYAYCYVEFKDGIQTFKIYQPFSKKMKWLNNHDSSVWDLWNQLPLIGEELIITSSRKDALCLWANLNIPSVSLQAEGYLPKPHIVNILKKKFDKVYVLYDNDYDKVENYGRKFGERLCQEYDLIQIEIPSVYQSKDPSDLYKNHGYHNFKNILNKLIYGK